MDDFVRGNEITLDDNSKYIVVDSFLMDNKHYLYIISEDDGKTTMVVEYKNGEVIEIEDKKELDKAFKVLIERNKEEIARYMEENGD